MPSYLRLTAIRSCLNWSNSLRYELMISRSWFNLLAKWSTKPRCWFCGDIFFRANLCRDLLVGFLVSAVGFANASAILSILTEDIWGNLRSTTAAFIVLARAVESLLIFGAAFAGVIQRNWFSLSSLVEGVVAVLSWWLDRCATPFKNRSPQFARDTHGNWIHTHLW